MASLKNKLHMENPLGESQKMTPKREIITLSQRLHKPSHLRREILVKGKI